MTSTDLDRLATFRHRDPHTILGRHPSNGGVVFRIFRPDVREAWLVDDVVDDGAPRPMERIHPGGVFMLEAGVDEVRVLDRAGSCAAGPRAGSS